jgi:hypothetical protein
MIEAVTRRMSRDDGSHPSALNRLLAIGMVPAFR